MSGGDVRAGRLPQPRTTARAPSWKTATTAGSTRPSRAFASSARPSTARTMAPPNKPTTAMPSGSRYRRVARSTNRTLRGRAKGRYHRFGPCRTRPPRASSTGPLDYPRTTIRRVDGRQLDTRSYDSRRTEDVEGGTMTTAVAPRHPRVSSGPSARLGAGGLFLTGLLALTACSALPRAGRRRRRRLRLLRRAPRRRLGLSRPRLRPQRSSPRRLPPPARRPTRASSSARSRSFPARSRQPVS